MAVLHVMIELAEQLRAYGLRPVVPEADDDPALWTAEAVTRHKRLVSKLHMDCIRDDRTKALLVANLDRHDTDNYIGPNTFAEIAVAFADDRPVDVDVSTCSVADSIRPPAASIRSTATAHRSRLRATREYRHTTITS